jgi:hypothetical protein
MPHIRLQRRPAEELTPSQIEILMEFGRREADLIDELEVAARAGDRERVWVLAQELVGIVGIERPSKTEV